jgi:hypothetical protein
MGVLSTVQALYVVARRLEVCITQCAPKDYYSAEDIKTFREAWREMLKTQF